MTQRNYCASLPPSLFFLELTVCATFNLGFPCCPLLLLSSLDLLVHLWFIQSQSFPPIPRREIALGLTCARHSATSWTFPSWH